MQRFINLNRKAGMAAVLLVFCLRLPAQVSITGPACILPGNAYQYVIHGSWNAGATVQLCVQGGVFQNGGHCIAAGEKPSSVIVTWSDSALMKLSLVSGSGNASMEVQATSALTGGAINDSDLVKTYDPGIGEYQFRCGDASGGACNPIYSYQWQKSVDGLNWINIGGATAKDLVFNSNLKVSTQFRRMCMESGSNTIVYSGTAMLVIE
ncbi:MAG: hypothetical protein HYZ15_06515 [Sphingobacteriales bacterium]|nr:hypothetical protein [Sphingobacteriales bacterium]